MFFTVVIPIYNMADCVIKALDSLKNQTNQNFEVLIVDDGSTDNIKDIIKPYLDKSPTWKYFYKQNGHWGSVINFVIKNNLINGDYVTILDADDWYINNAFLIIKEKLTKYSTIDFLICDSYNWFAKKNQKKRIYNAPFFSRFINSEKAINPWVRQLGKFYRRQLFNSLPFLEENVDFNDAFMQAYFANNAKSIYYLAKPLAYYWSDNFKSLTRWQENPTLTNWQQLFSIYEKADKINQKNREVAAIFIMNLWYFRHKLQFFYEKHQLPCVKIKTKGMKFKWLPWFVRIMPLKTFFKFKTKKWWQEREN